MNTTLKFGDALVALVASTLIACALLTGSGCALFSNTATQEQKVSDVRNLSRAAASIGTQEALLENPMWLPRFLAARAQLEKLVTNKTVTGALLRDVIASLPVKELKSPQARIAITTATTLFDATVGSQVNIESQPYVLAAASGILDGLRDALGQ
jgi:hypothetical protein